jgi:hypothetical protein
MLRYVNPKTKFSIELSSLTESERAFYEKAVRQFQRNVDWVSFDEFLFSPKSPIYAGRRSHLEVLRHPLYLALRDMWLQLGVQQGMIARHKEVRPAVRHRVTSVARSSSRRRARPAPELPVAAGVTS